MGMPSACARGWEKGGEPHEARRIERNRRNEAFGELVKPSYLWRIFFYAIGFIFIVMKITYQVGFASAGSIVKRIVRMFAVAVLVEQYCVDLSLVLRIKQDGRRLALVIGIFDDHVNNAGAIGIERCCFARRVRHSPFLN